MSEPLAYTYSHAPIPGGGYVTGFSFDPYEKDLLYCRTDIGGTYRYSREEARWISLSAHVGMEDLSETFPIALCADHGMLYIACGDGRCAAWNLPPDEKAPDCGRLCISDDKGEHFRTEEIPCYIHGNLNGRGTGRRLVCGFSGRLYFASQRNGLGIRKKDGSWNFTPVCGEEFLTFIYVSPDERMLIAGTAGISSREEERRGHSLYISRDGGMSFAPLKEPAAPSTGRYSGFVAHRYASDGKYLYISFSCSSPDTYAGWMGYSCDGGHLACGRVMRYLLSDPENSCEDITPASAGQDHGFGGIAAADGLLLCSTITKFSGDIIYISRDCGSHWEKALENLTSGRLVIRAPYLHPKYHGGHSPIHWMTDLAINPFNRDELWLNTGTGVFRCDNLTSKDRVFTDFCDGIEETVHLNLYSPPSGEVLLLDILGDLGGFAFRDLSAPCENSFADADGNRYITCINADFPDNDTDTFLVTARGNWTGLTRGGLILSRDNAKSWKRLPLPFGIHKRLDELCEGIERPNTNPGWCAVSADGRSFVFTAADGIRLYGSNAVSAVLDEDDMPLYSPVRIEGSAPDDSASLKVFSDRTDPAFFYGFGENSRLYVSSDGGRSFRELPSPLPEGIDFGLIDCADRTEIRGDAGFFGRFYLSAGEQGLWLLEYKKDSDFFTARKLTGDGDTVYRVGLGILDTVYSGAPKMLYISGIIDSHYGFYRSADNGRSWQLLNDDDHRFGEINSIEGDSRSPGRFFIASGSLGVIVGEPA